MRIIEQFFNIIAPALCKGCGYEGSLLCYYCREEALPVSESRCYKCGKLTEFSAVCRSCRRKTGLKHVFVRSAYQGSPKELVHAMKFKYSGEAADIIAEEMAGCLPAMPRDALVVHVPTISNHVRSRGFDHAARIAKVLASSVDRPHVPALLRLGQHRQVGSRRRERLAGMKGAFRPRMGYILDNAYVLLVDDVLTTGATLEAAAEMLMDAGARQVDAVVFARAK